MMAKAGRLSDSFGSVEDLSDEERLKIQPTTTATSGAPAGSTAPPRRASSRRWYSDSDEERDQPSSNQTTLTPELQSNQATMVNNHPANRRASASAVPSRTMQKSPPPAALDLDPTSKQPRPSSGFQKFLQKSKTLSPFRSGKKQPMDAPTPPPSIDRSELPTIEPTPQPAAMSRRQSRMMMRASSEALPPTPEDEPDDTLQLSGLDALSPGRGALGGAASGAPGSGVLLEGWLRQKQRRGIRGLKTWNSRYFVLYAKSNEMRYFSDVVQSGWGPIPLGELGCISLRSIQRISKPSHPKYKGCRFDITCRTTSHDENVLSSDDEKKKTTPKASREYCLVSDSPQTTVTWVSMLDSLLTRSVNSPRPETLPRGGSGASSAGSLKALVQQNIRQRHNSMPVITTTTDEPGSVFVLPTDIIPRAIVLAIEYIFESVPGIETPSFYEQEAVPSRLKSVITFLNQCAIEQRKPTRNECEDVLDVISAAGVVKLWLRQLEGPLVPVEMHEDYIRVMREGQHAPFDLRRNMKGLLAALPPKSFKTIAYLVFHWNDVTVYETKNKLTATALARLFAEHLFKKTNDHDEDASEAAATSSILQSIVEYMITNADVLIDEKEADLLDG
ncbi:hypothetical protein Ae201684P_006755 [Aphanomyces euteiches]|uniref:Rho-GAP domain-containing protein n=1 Tax=Aphanomyces euteiches TaxID=100861 RepID=A0A6G0X8N4_9STRA|nr:hypothetical protein Ae201684_007332 [Aphanomyces euteiches]KAH9100559.1 hypothetical protein Ae201684P_006755 [Aphanomyces euteiches]KAH9140930.1 hypothetical protein AeRB84_014852 [Aphanomyces euteiches]